MTIDLLYVGAHVIMFSFFFFFLNKIKKREHKRHMSYVGYFVGLSSFIPIWIWLIPIHYASFSLIYCLCLSRLKATELVF